MWIREALLQVYLPRQQLIERFIVPGIQIGQFFKQMGQVYVGIQFVLLGRLHDLEVVAAFVRRVAGRGPKVTAAAGKILDVIDAETRQLHARYLAEVTVLRTVAAAARDEVAPRLKRVSRRAAR